MPEPPKMTPLQKTLAVTICRHIKTNGCRCRSPRLRERDLCYFHARFYERQNVIQHSMVPAHSPLGTGNATYHPTLEPIELDLPHLEDAESIQVSISLLIAALARNRIDPKRAAILLYGLQLASANAKSLSLEPYTPTIARNVVPSDFNTDLAVDDSGIDPDEYTLLNDDDEADN